jgi:hypothetical protein
LQILQTQDVFARRRMVYLPPLSPTQWASPMFPFQIRTVPQWVARGCCPTCTMVGLSGSPTGTGTVRPRQSTLQRHSNSMERQVGGGGKAVRDGAELRFLWGDVEKVSSMWERDVPSERNMPRGMGWLQPLYCDSISINGRICTGQQHALERICRRVRPPFFLFCMRPPK